METKPQVSKPPAAKPPGPTKPSAAAEKKPKHVRNKKKGWAVIILLIGLIIIAAGLIIWITIESDNKMTFAGKSQLPSYLIMGFGILVVVGSGILFLI